HGLELLLANIPVDQAAGIKTCGGGAAHDPHDKYENQSENCASFHCFIPPIVIVITFTYTLLVWAQKVNDHCNDRKAKKKSRTTACDISPEIGGLFRNCKCVCFYLYRASFTAAMRALLVTVAPVSVSTSVDWAAMMAAGTLLNASSEIVGVS